MRVRGSVGADTFEFAADTFEFAAAAPAERAAAADSAVSPFIPLPGSPGRSGCAAP